MKNAYGFAEVLSLCLVALYVSDYQIQMQLRCRVVFVYIIRSICPPHACAAPSCTPQVAATIKANGELENVRKDLEDARAQISAKDSTATALGGQLAARVHEVAQLKVRACVRACVCVRVDACMRASLYTRVRLCVCTCGMCVCVCGLCVHACGVLAQQAQVVHRAGSGQRTC